MPGETQKTKKKSDYRAIKDHNGRSGSDRKRWKWFDLMDGIYGHRPASNGREGAIDSATTVIEAMMEDGKCFCDFNFSSVTVLIPLVESGILTLNFV